MSTHDQAQRTRWRRTAAVLALIVATALLLSACGDDDDEATAGSASGTTGSSGNGEVDWCGDEEVTLGIYDGGGLNAWSKESLEQVKLEADKCAAITKQIVVNAGFDPQKGVSGLRGLVAQGANAVVAIPDAGVCAELPAMRQATQRDVKVVAWAADPCGEPGTDVQDYVDWSPQAAGRLWTEWVAEQMGGKGNLLYLGGPAGNPVDAGHVKGVQQALEKYPDIELLENVTEESWPVTNWDPAEAQKVTSALLTKHDQIDGIVSSYGATSQGALNAFEGANRQMPPIATTEQNALACAWEDAKGTDKEFELATISSRNWLGRFAVRKAVAAVNGQTEAGKSIVELPLVEDSTDAERQPVCKPDASPEAYHSNDLPEKDFEAIVYGG